MNDETSGAEPAKEKSGAGRSRRRRRGWGVVLLAVAALALVERHTAIRAGDALPLVLGVAFLGWALAGRIFGLLIAGGILTGIGVGILAERWFGHGTGARDGLFLVCFAGGWLLIPLLGLAVFRRRVWWPLIPAAVLGVLGLGQLGYPELTRVWREARDYWPYALIVLGLVLLFKAPREK